MKHEDDRRVIYDWATGDFKSAKAVIVKKEIPIGDHFHLHKEEQFFLLQGVFKELQLGDTIGYNIEAPHKVVVPKGMYHRFICSEGSILLGTATESFDPNDELKNDHQHYPRLPKNGEV